MNGIEDQELPVGFATAEEMLRRAKARYRHRALLRFVWVPLAVMASIVLMQAIFPS